MGYRLIDEAAVYGNEKEAGQGIKRAIDEGIIKREDLFVTSKLWNTEHRKEHVEPACKKTLEDLGLDYIDLYLIHFPVSLKHIPFDHHYPPEWTDHPEGNGTMLEDPVPIHETWAAMEELHNKGLVKAIGISNMGTSLIRDILSYAKVKPSVLQVELHPLNAQPRLVKYCLTNGIAVTGYSSLGAPAYVGLGYAKKEEAAYDNPVVKDIAAAVGKSPAQVLFKWSLQRKIAVIPKSNHEERIKENLDLFSFSLSKDQMDAINGLNQNRRFNDPGHYGEASMGYFYPIYD